MVKSDKECLDYIETCSKCEVCLESCPTYRATGQILFSPPGRLQAVRTILEKSGITDEIIEAMLNCPECGECEPVCPENIPVSEIVAHARESLAAAEKIPLTRQAKIMNGIVNTGNSVRGDPEKRLAWMPEPFKETDSDTLFFAGCLPSYLVPEVATTSYLALKKAGIQFRVLKDEGCCGIYFFDAGNRKQAREQFQKNVERFQSLGIKKIIVPCVGCYRCFKTYYPEVLGSIDFEVYHVTEILADAIQKGNLKSEKIEKSMAYHDPCRLGRKSSVYEEPRSILRNIGINVVEFPQNKENGLCCGAGAGIRSLYASLSMDIAEYLLKNAPEKEIVTSCSFCLFNLKQAIKKRNIDKKIYYISELLV
ncbi:MAG: (Fe-S)-binding protein [Candidatus Helarchaeales archaeon]